MTTSNPDTRVLLKNSHYNNDSSLTPDVKKNNAGMFVYLVAVIQCFNPSLWQAVGTELCEK